MFINMQLQKSTALSPKNNNYKRIISETPKKLMSDLTSEELSFTQSLNDYADSGTKGKNVITSFLNNSFLSNKFFKSNDDLKNL